MSTHAHDSREPGVSTPARRERGAKLERTVRVSNLDSAAGSGLSARGRQMVDWLHGQFWLLPALMVVSGAAFAHALVVLDRISGLPAWLTSGAWIYKGSPSGAHVLLGAVATSTIAVAGTVFSITIAALSLAAGQMGPRLLQNFTRDRGNQFTLGAFLGTFAYALLVLGSVDSHAGDPFVPRIALSVSIALTFLCVGTLIYFVGHMAGRINVDTVIELVSDDFRQAIQRLLRDEPAPRLPQPHGWRDALMVRARRHGYLQQLDDASLARWAAEHGATVRLLVRPGHCVFPGVPIAFVQPQDVEGAEEAVAAALAVGDLRLSSADLEDAVRRLVEVAVRALSPGINDPNTAKSVLDRLGAGLCEVARLHMPHGQVCKDGRVVLLVPATDYDGLLDAMLHAIRQNAVTQPAVLIRILEVLTAAATCESDGERCASLQRHADLTLADAERCVAAPADLQDVRACYRHFCSVRKLGLPATLDAVGA